MVSGTLIKLDESTFVHVSEIAEASRCGNYTRVRLIGQENWQAKDIWDEYEHVWAAIKTAVERQR